MNHVAFETIDHAQLFHQAPVGYLVANPDGTIFTANTTMCDWAGVPTGALEGTQLLDLMPAGDRLIYRTYAGPKLEREGHLAELSIELLGPDGQRRPVLLSVNRSLSGTKPLDLMIFFAAPERRRYERELASAHRQLQDIEIQRAQLLREAHHQASHDQLTGLPNRRHFQENLLAALAHAGEQRTRMGLLFCDVNNFKQINDTLGHAAGDHVLEHIGRRIVGAVRREDSVARLSGDEFVVLVPGLRHLGELDTVAERVRGSVAGVFAIAGTELQIAISVGQADTVVPQEAGEVEHQELAKALLNTADRDMYRVKTGRGVEPAAG